MENIEIQFSTDGIQSQPVRGNFTKTEKGGTISFSSCGATITVYLENEKIRICNQGQISYELPLDKDEFEILLSTAYGSTLLKGITDSARYVIGSERVFVDCKYTLIYGSGEKDIHSVKIVGRFI